MSDKTTVSVKKMLLVGIQIIKVYSPQPSAAPQTSDVNLLLRRIPSQTDTKYVRW